jgi:hypothetical protein
MSELLKIGDVVVLKSEIELQPIIRKEALPTGEIVDFTVDRGAIKMTVEYVNDSYTDDETDEDSIYEDVELFDVIAVYFNGGVLNRINIKHGSLKKVD